jgi:cellulose synthase/poly-beta-1,6-N-acetylglucosamine synthase-like glycosyltransferase
MSILESILFLLFCIPVSYLAFFALAAMFSRKEPEPTLKNARKMVILLPAYREDGVIEESVHACFAQQYPRELFEVVVISDKMKDATNERLSKMAIRLVKVVFEKSTKAKSLNFALKQIEGFDIAIVLDADNVIEPLFLQKINAAFESGSRIVQAHRMAKNLNTNFAILDAISEEVNNSIFRKGHANVGLSSALIGSGMAFEFEHFKFLIDNIQSIGGEDKELEHVVLFDGIKIDYLHHAEVLDEKIQRASDFSNQRKRWLSAQFETLQSFLPQLGAAIRAGNIHFCDKVYQMAFPPRILLVGVLFLATAFFTVLDPPNSLKWWVLFGILFTTIMISIPRRLYTFQLLKAFLSIPYVFVLMFANLFKLKGAGKHFIHTSHGINDGK